MNESDSNQNGEPAERNEAPPPVADAHPLSEAFYERAIWRMQRAMVAVGLGVIAFAGLRFGAAAAVGAALGAALSWHNFRWLAKVVNALGERITTGQSRERGGLIVLRFTLRILLMGVGAYAIFKYSRGGLYGYVAGLCVPVPALFFEAAYELFAAYRRGI
ncbi:MAG: ATP synthase subunit I [Candidatus Korobacteraceae bacterium]|jgi:hypothetical protein